MKEDTGAAISDREGQRESPHSRKQRCAALQFRTLTVSTPSSTSSLFLSCLLSLSLLVSSLHSSCHLLNNISHKLLFICLLPYYITSSSFTFTYIYYLVKDTSSCLFTLVWYAITIQAFYLYIIHINLPACLHYLSACLPAFTFLPPLPLVYYLLGLLTGSTGNVNVT